MAFQDNFAHAKWIRELRKKQKNGVILSEEELRALAGEDALAELAKTRMSKGAYVRVKCDLGMIEGTIIGKDDEGNYLLEYARGHHALIRPEFVSKEYHLRDTALIEQDQYVIGDGLYKRIVAKDGLVKKFFDTRLERKRIQGEEIIFPDDEHRAPGDDWGIRIV